MHTNTHTHTHTHTHTYTHTCRCTCTPKCTHVYTHAHLHTYTPTHTLGVPLWAVALLLAGEHGGLECQKGGTKCGGGSGGAGIVEVEDLVLVVV
jgi:hypothetical protein